MKNKFLLLVLFTFISICTFARTPRVSNKTFSYETLKLPSLALPENRSYHINLITAKDYQNLGLRYENAIQIPGWTKTLNGTYEVNIKLFSINYLPVTIEERCEFIRDTANIIVDTIWFYKNQFKAVANGNYEIIDAQNNVVFTNKLLEICLQNTGKEYRTPHDARRHSHMEAQIMQGHFIESFIQNFTAQSNKNLDVLLGIYSIRLKNELLIVRNKKHSEFVNMQLFWKSFQNKTDLLTAKSNLKSFEKTLSEEINYLKNLETKYFGNNKADKKIRYMAYRNLTKIYQMLEMPEQEIFYAQKIRNNDFKKYNAPYIIADAQRMKKLQEIHGIVN